jgi:hypothetical protein
VAVAVRVSLLKGESFSPRRALAHVFEMTLARHRLDEEVAQRPDQRIDPVWRESRSLTVKIRRERALLILKCRERADVVNAAPARKAPPPVQL